MLADLSLPDSPARPGLGSAASGLTTASPSGRFWPELHQLRCAYDISHSTLWSFMEFDGRPSFNPALLADFHAWQDRIAALRSEAGGALKYVVLGSDHPSVFCLGGDLDYFSECIAARDAEALTAYGRSCIEILHRNWRSIDCGVTTIGLAQGDALGGGFEALLSFDILCAERGAKFGFPEQLFGVFPGMGALSFLGRKLGFAKAEWMVRTGKTLTAEEMFDLGVVHLLAEPGEGLATVQRYIARNASRQAPQHRMHQACKTAAPIPFHELDDIVGLWVEACMALEDHHLQVMRRIIGAQSRLAA